MKAHAICDGSGNGKLVAARAAILFLPDGREIERANRMDPTTNIVAEHMAIQLCIEMALEFGVSDLLIFNDSQVPVYQVDGTYKCEKPHLKPIVEETWEMASKLNSVKIEWTPRENTERADLLARAITESEKKRISKANMDKMIEAYRQKPHRVRRKASRRNSVGRKGMMS